MSEKALPLPVAMRVEEISERDFEVLFRIAEDVNAASGRLKHAPRRIPLRDPARKSEVVKLTPGKGWNQPTPLFISERGFFW